MMEEELAVKCLPAALAKLATNDDLALQALADKACMPLKEALEKYGCHVVAKYLFGIGEPPSCHLVNARCSQVQHWLQTGSPAQGVWQQADGQLGMHVALQAAAQSSSGSWASWSS